MVRWYAFGQTTVPYWENFPKSHNSGTLDVSGFNPLNLLLCYSRISRFSALCGQIHKVRTKY